MYTPRQVCTPRYTKSVHTFLRNPRHRYRRTEFYYGRYRLPRLHRLQNAPTRIARIGADTPSTKTNCMCEARCMCACTLLYTYIYARAHGFSSRIHRVRVRLSRSVIDDRFAVKRRNLDAEIIGSAAFSICSKLSRSHDGRAKNASTRLSSSIEWIARSTPRTHSRFDERQGAFRKMRVTWAEARN